MKKHLLLAALMLPLFANAQKIFTLAGTGGSVGDAGLGGPATAALLKLPQGLATDKFGNVYVTNHDHGTATAKHQIRKIDAAGVYSVFAGIGPAGYSGDGGPATAAQMDDPLGMCTDASGNVYVVEEVNGVVRKISTAGIITTIAGNGTHGYSGDGGPATDAQLADPQSVKIDNAGNLYVADYGNYVVRKISASGIITTLAGNGTPGYTGDGGPATAAQMERPADIAIDAAGNVYISEDANHVIRVVKNDTIYTYAGLLAGGFAGDGGPATAARFWAPWGLNFDSSGNLLVVDTKNNRIRQITPAGIITTVMGDGTNSMSSSAPWGAFGGDGGAATAGKLYWPAHVAVGAKGSFYVTDQSNHVIRRFDTAKVLVPSLLGNIDANSRINLAPNPCAGSIAVSGVVAADYGGMIQISIRDAFGRQVHSVSVLQMGGLFSAEVDMGGFAAGLYYASVAYGDKKETITFVKRE